MHRFYLDYLSLDSTLVIAEEGLVHQISKVLRGKPGERFSFFDGKESFDYIYQLEKFSKEGIHFTLIEKVSKTYHPRTVVLFQGMPNKWDKIEYMVQKWVEVWIQSFIFFPSDFSQKLFINDSKIERIKKIMIEALEQSGGNALPSLEFFPKFPETLCLWWQNILLHHLEDTSSQGLKEVQYSKKVHIFVWPEWGWSDTEVQKFETLWCQKVHFGESILRCETVGPVIGFYIQNI